MSSIAVRISPRPGGRRVPGLATIIALVAAVVFAACSPTGATPSATPTAAATPASTATPTSAPSPIPTASPTPVATLSASPGASANTSLVCTSPATPTISVTEGPYYTAGAPQKTTLVETGMAGTRLTLIGYVVNTTCQPLANAKVDVWQADASGEYDNSGYRLRGYVLTDASGRFTIETIIPGQYPGRTEHIHVKVTPDGGAPLTTQLFFPDEANQSDTIYSGTLLLTMTPSGSAYLGTFTFVLA